MIDFACKKIDLEDIFRCSFSLKKTDFRIMMALINNSGLLGSVKLSALLGLDRTTIQKSLKFLLKKDLIKRQQQNLSSGGYTYLYSIKNKTQVKTHILDLLNRWHDLVNDEINNL